MKRIALIFIVALLLPGAMFGQGRTKGVNHTNCIRTKTNCWRGKCPVAATQHGGCLAANKRCSGAHCPVVVHTHCLSNCGKKGCTAPKTTTTTTTRPPTFRPPQPENTGVPPFVPPKPEPEDTVATLVVPAYRLIRIPDGVVELHDTTAGAAAALRAKHPKFSIEPIVGHDIYDDGVRIARMVEKKKEGDAQSAWRVSWLDTGTSEEFESSADAAKAIKDKHPTTLSSKEIEGAYDIFDNDEIFGKSHIARLEKNEGKPSYTVKGDSGGRLRSTSRR